MEITTIILVIAAGFAAGVINTLAGSGSIITLALLTHPSLIGLSAHIANGTNRIGILFQSGASSYKFYKKGMLNDLLKDWKIILITTIGALGGVFTANVLNPKDFEFTVGCIFLGLFFILLFKPQKYLKSTPLLVKIVPYAMFLIGFYAGFIQAGAGVFMLAVLATVQNKKITEINPLKVFIILCINVCALIGYAIEGNVNWTVGLILAVGQFAGAFVGVRLNNSKKDVEPILRLVLLGLVLLSIVKFWGIL